MTSTPATESRRHFTRVVFRGRARLNCAGTEHDVVVHDLALKGALVESATPLAVTLGDKARLVLSLDDDGDFIELQGHLVHHEGLRLGLKCDDIDVDSLTNLRRLVELNLGDASLVDRELSQLFQFK